MKMKHAGYAAVAWITFSVLLGLTIVGGLGCALYWALTIAEAAVRG